jgi:hypothetical protein
VKGVIIAQRARPKGRSVLITEFCGVMTLKVHLVLLGVRGKDP